MFFFQFPSRDAKRRNEKSASRREQWKMENECRHCLLKGSDVECRMRRGAGSSRAIQSHWRAQFLRPLQFVDLTHFISILSVFRGEASQRQKPDFLMALDWKRARRRHLVQLTSLLHFEVRLVKKCKPPRKTWTVAGAREWRASLAAASFAKHTNN